MGKQRYHFLDGLRGAAMLLGLVLHGVLSFAGIPIWPAEDVRSAPELIYPVIDVVRRTAQKENHPGHGGDYLEL